MDSNLSNWSNLTTYQHAAANKKMPEKQEVISIFSKYKCIGFICRKSVLFAMSNTCENDWFVTKDLLKPDWFIGGSTRAEARKVLEKMDA